MIVGSLARHGDVVNVALAQARSGDAHELRLAVEFVDGAAAGITHGGAKPADDLVHHRTHRPLIGDLAFHAFRHQLERVAHFRLEVAVGGTTRHRTHAAHAAI